MKASKLKQVLSRATGKSHIDDIEERPFVAYYNAIYLPAPLKFLNT